MTDIDVYMSPLEPTVIEWEDTDGVSTEDDEITILMVPKDSPGLPLYCPLLPIDADYIMALWDPGKKYLSWERTYIEFSRSEYVSPKIGITVVVKQPNSDLTCIPWWSHTIVSARNPDKILPHSPFIVDHYRDSSIDLGEVPNTSSEDDNFNRTVDETYTHNETQPIVRPGEYITLQWKCKVNGKVFTGPMFNLKYETPLFTGGIITAKIGEAVETVFTVNIFGEEKTGVIPTDFYDYQVGDWVYLMKVDAALTLDEKTENKQMYGSEGIASSEDVGDLFDLVNNERNEVGLDSLYTDSVLASVAQGHADDLAEHGIINNDGHLGSDGSRLIDRINASTYPPEEGAGDWGVGENVVVIYELPSGKTEAEAALDAWMGSPGHKSNLLNSVWLESGLARAVATDGAVYYVQVFGYKETNVDGEYDGDYRIVPFNFGGPMNSSCGISFNDSIGLDSSSDFEKVFDMIKYECVILSIDYENDTADIVTEFGYKTDVPIFYYCDDQDEPTVEGGSSAFSKGDLCIVEVPSGTDWDDAKIIGFPNGLKQCELTFDIDASVLFNFTIYTGMKEYDGELVSNDYSTSDYLPVYVIYKNYSDMALVDQPLHLEGYSYEFAGRYEDNRQNTRHRRSGDNPYIYGLESDESTKVLKRTIDSIVPGINTTFKVKNHRLNYGPWDFEYELPDRRPYEPGAINYPANTLYSDDALFIHGRYVYFMGFSGNWSILNGLQKVTVVDDDTYTVNIDTSALGDVGIFGKHLTPCVWDMKCTQEYRESMHWNSYYKDWKSYGRNALEAYMKVKFASDSQYPDREFIDHINFGYVGSNPNDETYFLEDELPQSCKDYAEQYGIDISKIIKTTYYSYEFESEVFRNCDAVYLYTPDTSKSMPYRSKLKRPYRTEYYNYYRYKYDRTHNYQISTLCSTDLVSGEYSFTVQSYTRTFRVYDWDDNLMYEKTDFTVPTGSWAKTEGQNSTIVESGPSTGGSYYQYDPTHLYVHNGYIGIYGYVDPGNNEHINDEDPEGVEWIFIPLEETDETQEGNIWGIYGRVGIFSGLTY